MLNGRDKGNDRDEPASERDGSRVIVRVVRLQNLPKRRSTGIIEALALTHPIGVDTGLWKPSARGLETESYR
jgi:hypothetical protein